LFLKRKEREAKHQSRCDGQLEEEMLELARYRDTCCVSCSARGCRSDVRLALELALHSWYVRDDAAAARRQGKESLRYPPPFQSVKNVDEYIIITIQQVRFVVCGQTTMSSHRPSEQKEAAAATRMPSLRQRARCPKYRQATPRRFCSSSPPSSSVPAAAKR